MMRSAVFKGLAGTALITGFYFAVLSAVSGWAFARSQFAADWYWIIGLALGCCSHYLINILPIIGVAGFAALIAQYQRELFLVSLGMNVLGIGYLVQKLTVFRAVDNNTVRHA